MTTHFADNDLDLSKADRLQLTLCGQKWEAVIMNERPPTCLVCTDKHAKATGWSFPLPPVVE